MAIDTVLRLFDIRRMIALLVESSRKLQDFLGAEFDAEPTAFASIVKDMHHAARNLNVVHIQGGSPESHDITLNLFGILQNRKLTPDTCLQA
jgi:hypothetical protein